MQIDSLTQRSIEDKARAQARNSGEDHAVVIIDSGDGSETWITAPVSYCDTDEYHAFNGRMVCVVSPSGEFDY